MSKLTSELATLQSDSFVLKKRNKNSYILNLKSPTDNVTLFGDRPERSASSESLESFANDWDKNFLGSAPNGSFTYRSNKNQPQTAVFKINKFKYTKNGNLKLVVNFSDEQKLPTKIESDLLSPKLDKRSRSSNSLFIDGFPWPNWSADTSLKIKNNTGKTMTINWDNSGDPSKFETDKKVIKLSDGHTTKGSEYSCNPEILGSTTGSYDVAARVFITGTEIDEWWFDAPDIGRYWYSNSNAAEWWYDNQQAWGKKVQGDWAYPWEVSKLSKPNCTNFGNGLAEWTLTYDEPIWVGSGSPPTDPLA